MMFLCRPTHRTSKGIDGNTWTNCVHHNKLYAKTEEQTDKISLRVARGKIGRDACMCSNRKHFLLTRKRKHGSPSCISHAIESCGGCQQASDGEVAENDHPESDTCPETDLHAQPDKRMRTDTPEKSDDCINENVMKPDPDKQSIPDPDKQSKSDKELEPTRDDLLPPHLERVTEARWSDTNTETCNHFESKMANGAERNFFKDCWNAGTASLNCPGDNEEFALDFLRSRVRDLHRIKAELEKTRRELVETKEQARKEKEEAGRLLRIEVDQAVALVREEMNKDLLAAKEEVHQINEKMKVLEKQKDEDILQMKKLTNEQIVAIRKKCEEDLKAARTKARRSSEAALQSAEERAAKRLDTAQRQMAGKMEAAERAHRREMEELRLSSQRQVDIHDRRAEQAAVKYNKLIAEHMVLQDRISEAVKLLDPGERMGDVKNGRK